jgi:glycosyltransferase involved in cell wall biosynthesis
MLMPLGVEKFDLSKYDLVVSDSASFAKGVIVRPKTRHICYCHTPTRYVWDDSHKYVREFSYPGFIKNLAPPLLSYLRLWDEAASARPDFYIANSFFVAQRIKKYYNRPAEVIYPPVKTNYFFISKKIDDYFLLVSRFLPYKKIDLAIEAFNRLGWPLKIIGDGPEGKQLKKIAKANIEFVGQVPEKKLKDYYVRCQALIFPQEEDFGIVAVEAMAAGRPVIAYEAGGALEIIKDGETGMFFKEQTADCLIAILKKFRTENFSPETIREEALRFDKEVFKSKIKAFVGQALESSY